MVWIVIEGDKIKSEYLKKLYENVNFLLPQQKLQKYTVNPVKIFTRKYLKITPIK